VSWTPPMPDRDQVREDELAAYDRVVEQQKAYNYVPFVQTFLHPEVRDAFPGDRLQPYFAAMLNSPLISAGMSNLGVVYRSRGAFEDGMTHADREWVDMVLCDEVECLWVLYVHAPDAIAVGVRAEAIVALVEGRYDDFTDDEREKDSFIRAVINGTMTEDRYKSLERKLGVRATVELTCFTGHLLKTMRIMQAFGVPDTTREHLTEWVKALAAGEIDLPPSEARTPSPELAAALVSGSA
jgi:hypothetical protein